MGQIKYYLRRGTSEEAIEAINDLVDYYDKNADMSLEFNQVSLLVKLGFIRSQIQSDPAVDLVIKKAIEYIESYRGA